LEKLKEGCGVFSGAALDDERRILAEKGLIMEIYHLLSSPSFRFFPLFIG